MILKELDPFHYGSQDALAVRVSADRVAYTLRRFFRRSSEIDVLNGLCVLAGSGFARVDHLLLHPFGLIVLQRESMAGRVRIDDDGQWVRRISTGVFKTISGRVEVRTACLWQFLMEMRIEWACRGNISRR